jgi:hypothetical protein
MKEKSAVESFNHWSNNAEGRVQEFFDHQAATFEKRAGLPADCCRDIARAVMYIGETRKDDLLLELGPGTGQIGRWFEERVRYVGLDLSEGMLREFRAHLYKQGMKRRALVRADGQSTWPVADGCARVIFSSRAAHLLEQEHVAQEFFRVASNERATLIIGRVRREPQSTRARMAREMNERLRGHGLEGRGGEVQSRKLFEACRHRGAEILEPSTVARWTVSASPQQSLDSWRSLRSLGGINVSAPAREEILKELESWARTEFGSLEREHESEETYVLYPLRL